MHAAAPMWRNGRRNGLKIRWAVKGPCRFESGHRHPLKLKFSQGDSSRSLFGHYSPRDIIHQWSYVPDAGADNENYFNASTNSGTLHKKYSILSRVQCARRGPSS